MSQTAPARGAGRSWLWPLALTVIGAPLLIIVVTFLIYDAAFLVGIVRVGLVLVLVLLGAGGTIGIAALWTRLASPAARASAEAIALARAQHIELPDGLHSFSMPAGPRHQEREPARLNAPEIIDVAAEPPPQLPAPQPEFSYGMSRLEQLVRRGHVARSGDSIFVGLDATLRPRYVEADQWGLMVVGGQTQKGKSLAAGLIIAQAALMGWDLFICDPVYHRPKSLLREYLAGMTGAIYRQAVRPNEIAATVRLVTRIAQRRIGGDARERRVLLVLDEFSALVGNRHLSEELLDALALMVLQSSAAGVHTLIVGHDFNARMFGARFARPFRSAATHRLLFCMDPEAAELVLPTGEAARQVGILPPGQALFADGLDTPTLITVPEMRPDDLAYAAQGRAPRLYTPWEGRPDPQITPPPRPAPIDVTPQAPEPRQAPPTTRLPDPPLADLIVDLLAAHPAGLDADSIATKLSAANSSTKTRLAELKAAGVVDARPASAGARRFVYSLIRRPPTA